ncbi:hypothetical protein D3C78_1151210 [compost metagenome]
MKQQLNGVRAGHAPHLVPHTNPAALVSAGNARTLNTVMKHRAATRQSLRIIRYRESAIMQTFADLRKKSSHKYRVLDVEGYSSV